MPQKISIRGIIGFDVTAQDIREQFKTAAGEDVILEINSPGGDLLDGIDIYNQIKQYEGKVTAHIFGMAASAASYLAVAADSIRAEDNSVFMIHNAWLIAIGDYKEMQKVGEPSGFFFRSYCPGLCCEDRKASCRNPRTYGCRNIFLRRRNQKSRVC